MVAIRPAGPADAAGVRRVAEAAYRETYVPIVGHEGVADLLSAWYDPDALRERLATDAGTRTFVAVDADASGDAASDRVVGYAGAAVSDDPDADATLGTLYVHPERWGEGIGSRLFERARSHLAGRGAERMRIRVLADNDVGRSFYEDRAELVAETRDELDPLGETVRTAVYEASVS